jgi:hypothetical protein
MSNAIIVKRLKSGPARSSELAKLLVDKENITPDAARKRLSRLKTPFAKVPNLSLEKNESIFYLKDQFNSSLFKDSVMKILEDSNTAEGRLLRAIGLSGQTIPLSYLAKSSGTTFVNKSRKHAFLNNVLARLLDLELIYRIKDSKYSAIIAMPGYEQMRSDVRANFEVEDIFLSIVQSWLIKLGFCSTNSISVREHNKCREYGMFEWDLMGPTYLNGFVSKRTKGHKGSFIVGDIVFGREISLQDLKPFFYKIDALNQQGAILPFQPIFIADYFANDALHTLRNKGVLIATPSNIFDQEVAIALKSLKNVLSKAFTSYEDTPENVFEIIKKINKIEGASLNLRGIFLDFVAARIFHHRGYRCVIREKFRLNDGTSFEFDVVANRTGENILVEGKALISGNEFSVENLQDWYDKTYPKLMKWIKEQGDSSERYLVEFWVSTSYQSECQPLISSIKNKCKKVPIEFRDYSFVTAELKRFNEKSIIDSFREQFKQ